MSWCSNITDGDAALLTEEKAKELMKKLIRLRKRAERTKNKNDIEAFKTHENLCIQKFKYLVTMRTNRYAEFANHDDLIQEGFEALLKAMKNYNPKFSWYWWAHKYIDTRIARCANQHTTIRFPMKYAREHKPHKESTIPTMVEQRFCPDKILENVEMRREVERSMDQLPNTEKTIVSLLFGIGTDRPISISKICKKLSMSRMTCLKAVTNALSSLKETIKI